MNIVFGKWEVPKVEVEQGLKKYISLQPRILPRTSGRLANKRFYKSKMFIVERLLNKLMVSGHRGKKHNKTSMRFTGMKAQATKILMKTLEIIYNKTKENPIKVLVKAIENAAPREEIVPIEYGGARYPKAVDCAPQRRIDLALRWFIHSAYDKSFNGAKAIEDNLADEVIYAYRADGKSFAISKKLQLEQQAAANR